MINDYSDEEFGDLVTAIAEVEAQLKTIKLTNMGAIGLGLVAIGAAGMLFKAMAKQAEAMGQVINILNEAGIIEAVQQRQAAMPMQAPPPPTGDDPTRVGRYTGAGNKPPQHMASDPVVNNMPPDNFNVERDTYVNGYDPGPQEVPPEVKAVMEAEGSLAAELLNEPQI